MRLHREILLGLLLLCQMSCRDLPPQIHVPTIYLSLEDRGVIDASLRVSVDADEKPNRVKILLDGIAIFDANAKDTVAYCDTLMPKQSYTLKAYRLNGNTIFDSSEALTITTLDSASHNFTWQIDTLGDGANSYLSDVAILSDSCAYAVGAMYFKDSTGRINSTPYGVGIWNGRAWQVKHLFYSDNAVVAPIRGVLAFGPNDVWLAAGSVFHWDGISSQVSMSLSRLSLSDPNATIEKIWGSSSTNLYGVGYAGTIVYYNGKSWQQIESGTHMDLVDVHGSPDGNMVWACGYYRSQVGTFLFRNGGQGWELAYDGTSSEFRIRPDSLSGAFTSVYTPSAKRIFVGSSAGVYAAPSTTQGIGKRLSFTSTYFPGFPNRLRGNGINDFTIVGDYGFVAHFNGLTWQYYDQLSTSDIRLQSVAQQGNLLCAVGHLFDPINSRAIVLRGRR